MNKQGFFQQVKKDLFGGKLSPKKVEGIEAIIDYWQAKGIADNRQLAYILATIYHETAKTMQAIKEIGSGKGKAYGKRLKMNRQPYTDTKNLFYGRGLVQITWYENYEKAGDLLKLDLISYPDIMLQLLPSVKVTIEGMLSGMFTTRKLSDYFNSTRCEPVRARKIINGLDCAEKISQYYSLFLAAIEKNV